MSLSLVLPEPFSVKELSPREFAAYFKEQRNLVYGAVTKLDVMGLLEERERKLLHQLGGRLRQRYSLYLQFLHEDQPIGFSYGVQNAEDTFHMASTGLLPEFRGKGLYSAFLKALVEYLGREGFQKVQSYHHPSNVGVLIPKLKNGFVITGMELNEVYGSLLKLTCFTNPARKEAWEVRIGARKLSDDLGQFLDI
ncbi:MAG: GNAT family N-acetyltransferase [Bacteroidota bacterium]